MIANILLWTLKMIFIILSGYWLLAFVLQLLWHWGVLVQAEATPFPAQSLALLLVHGSLCLLLLYFV